MPFASANGASLYYEATGAGFPLVFVHEFGGDYRSWEPQVRYFSRRHLCVTYNARGYPPSDVPKEPSAYSQAIATDDLVSVLRHLRIPSAQDRKSTRLNSSHSQISYAVFCLKKKI